MLELPGLPGLPGGALGLGEGFGFVLGITDGILIATDFI
jgi:hypothetical protein